MKYGHVGRPSNEEVKKRKKKQIFKVLVPIIIVLIGIILITNSGNLNRLMGNETIDLNDDEKYYCEDESYQYDKENKECYKEEEISSIIIGDTNLDGKLNDDDLKYIEAILNHTIEINNDNMLYIDMDDDNLITQSDYEKINNIIAEIEEDPEYELERICPMGDDHTFYELTQDKLKCIKKTIMEAKEKNLKEQPEQQEIPAEQISNEYTISFDSINDKIVVKNGDYYGNLPVLEEKEGYTFMGWYTKIEGQGGHITNDTIVNISSNITLYPYYKPNTYTIYLDANGGKVANQVIKAVYGKRVKLPNPNKQGYEFKKWIIVDEIDENIIISDNSFIYNYSKNLKIKADYKPKDYKITFDCNGGYYYNYYSKKKAKNAKATYMYGKKFSNIIYTNNSIDINKIEREGYIFKGWYTKDRKKIEKNTEMTFGDITLYAHWKPKKYKIAFFDLISTSPFDFDCKTKRIKPIEITYDKKIGKLPVPETKNCGYTFVGWYTKKKNIDGSSNGSGKKITSQTVLNNVNDFSVEESTNNLILFPFYKPNTYTITYDANGGTVNPTSQKILYGRIKGYKQPIPKRKGFKFGGWYGNYKGKKLYIQDDGQMYLNHYRINNNIKNITVHAEWNPKTYMVLLKGDNYKFNFSDSFFVHCNEKKILTTTKPIKEGYIFQGWYTKNGTKVDLTIQSICNLDKNDITNIELYPKWTRKINFKVTLKSNGGTENNKYQTIDTFTVTKGGKYPKLKTVKGEQGCKFQGWYTTPNITNEKRVKSYDKVTINNDIVLYATWHC